MCGVWLFWALVSGMFSSETAVRCMIQMKNYEGEGAYIVTGLVDERGEYIRTLHVCGDDDEWYYELEDWWKFHGRSKSSVDGITGPTLAGGERATFQFAIHEYELDRGYGIRFESGVENEGHHPAEVVVPLTSDLNKSKVSGHGFIRYVRLLME